METQTLITLICAVGALLISLNSTFQSRRGAKDAQDTLKEYEAYKRENEKRFITLELFMKVLEKDLDRMLHSPHRIELDEFSEKSQREELTREDALEYAKVLEETLHDPKLKPGEEVGIKLRKAMLIAKFQLLELLHE